MPTHCDNRHAIVNSAMRSCLQPTIALCATVQPMQKEIIAWLKRGLDKPDKTQRGLAEALGIDPAGVNRMLKGLRQIKVLEVKLAARYLDESPPQSVTSIGLAESPSPFDHDVDVTRFGPAPHNRLAVRWLDIIGVAVGGTGGGDFEMNGEVVDRVPCPPGLVDATNAFALFVTGESMVPRFKPGEIIFIHPGRPYQRGDDVLVILRDGATDLAGPALIKELVRLAHDHIILKQWNPPDDQIRIANRDIKRIYRIMGSQPGR